LFSSRLPHVVTARDLVVLLAPTYAAARGVDEQEAMERLTRALQARGALDDVYRGLSSALAAAKGPRTSEDALVDKLSAGVAARRARVKAAPITPAVAAVLVRLDLEVGLAADAMRETLATPRARALLDEGLHALGAHLLRGLMKS
jgi:hypothetical protein